MIRLRKRIKWWWRDLLASRRGRDASKELKTIHLLHCRSCNGFHRFGFKITTYGRTSASDDPEPLGEPLGEEFFPCGKRTCPKTGEIYYAAQEDWLHLTEREFDLGVPPKHK
jgi:hypothetical protein